MGGRKLGVQVAFAQFRSRGTSALAVIAGCLAVYAVFAMVFHWLVEPTVKSQPVAVRSEPASRVTAKARTSSTATTAAPEMTGSVRSQTSRVTSNPSGSTPPSIMAPEFKQAARSEPPPLWVVRKPGTSAAANTSKSRRPGKRRCGWSQSRPPPRRPRKGRRPLPSPRARTLPRQRHRKHRQPHSQQWSRPTPRRPSRKSRRRSRARPSGTSDRRESSGTPGSSSLRVRMGGPRSRRPRSAELNPRPAQV